VKERGKHEGRKQGGRSGVVGEKKEPREKGSEKIKKGGRENRARRSFLPRDAL